MKITGPNFRYIFKYIMKSKILVLKEKNSLY